MFDKWLEHEISPDDKAYLAVVIGIGMVVGMLVIGTVMVFAYRLS